MTIIGDKVILRDFLPEDIPKRVEWETVETEWQSWDAPWEYDGLTAEEKQADLNRYGENMRRWAQQPPLENERRTGFQICLNTKEREYIGWCSAYRIDEAFRFARDGCYCAVDVYKRQGYDAQLDQLRHAATHGREMIASMEASEREATGIKNLKISYNRV